MKTTRATEDYLEALLVLEQEGKPLEITEVAKHLNVSKPAATQMMADLKNKGLIDKEPYSGIRFTEEGRAIASATLHRHKVLKEFFLSFGVDPEIAEEDCCKVEHVISQETFDKIEEYISKK